MAALINIRHFQAAIELRNSVPQVFALPYMNNSKLVDTAKTVDFMSVNPNYVSPWFIQIIHHRIKGKSFFNNAS